MENAYFDLCGEDSDTKEDTKDEAPRNAADLLSNDKHRFDIELESIGNREGLWNSQVARMIYRHIVSCKFAKSIEICSFCMDVVY